MLTENRELELKETITNTFLKTVSAFANYGGGQIVFGVRDDGTIAPLKDTKQTCLDIENRINDSISPQPDYELKVTNEGKTITLTILPGFHKPYMYKSKAYKRNDTATVEVDQLELTRLILEGKNISYESLPAENQQLSFHVLGAYLKERPGIGQINDDVLKTLELKTEANGYNKAAEILADQNDMPGISLVKFGEDVNTIQKRYTAAHHCVLSEIDEIIGIFRDYYVIEKVGNTVRQKIETIPSEAFKEALVNAVIHRTWDVQADISVFMYDEKIEITSPGGLMPGITREEYLRGGISIPRNRILANIFLRTGVIEKLGTGILRIRSAYQDAAVKPQFEIYDQSIRVILPVLRTQDLTEDENAVYRVLSRVTPLSTKEVTDRVDFGKSKVLGILQKLVDRNMIEKSGNGRGTKYRKK